MNPKAASAPSANLTGGASLSITATEPDACAAASAGPATERSDSTKLAGGPGDAGGLDTSRGTSSTGLGSISMPRVHIPGEVYRDTIKRIISAWRKYQPAEAERFYKRANDWKRWLREQGTSATAKRTQYCPTFTIPMRVYECMTRQFTPDGATEPFDWLRDPDIRRVFFEELAICKLTPHPDYRSD